MARICSWFGITRQAHYQQSWRDIEVSIEAEIVLKEVERIRKDHRMMGVRKLQIKLAQFLRTHQIKLGRDALFDLLSAHNMLIKKRRTTVKTTNSRHWMKKYPNLIRGIKIDKTNQVWVSDITYWKTKLGFVYISLITDAYSRKVVGYSLSENLESEGPLEALANALKGMDLTKVELIHHSDRGAQYCSGRYTNRLKQNNILISMTESGDPRENAIAERVNGILKNEYLTKEKIDNYDQAKKLLAKTIIKYNEERPHMSISNLTPEYLHQTKNQLETKKLWKKYYTLGVDQDGLHYKLNNTPS